MYIVLCTDRENKGVDLCWVFTNLSKLLSSSVTVYGIILFAKMSIIFQEPHVLFIQDPTHCFE